MMGRPMVVSGRMAGVAPAAHRQGCAGPPPVSLLDRTRSRLPRLQHVLPSEPHAAKRDHPTGGQRCRAETRKDSHGLGLELDVLATGSRGTHGRDAFGHRGPMVPR